MAGFFSGCTDFEISGGTFNDVRGNLNQRRVNHYNVQYNSVNGNLTRYNSPTIVNFGVPPRMFDHNLADPPPPQRRGAGRGNLSGVRMEPYSTGRGPEPFAQLPPPRTNRIPGRGDVPSPYESNPSQATPIPNRGHGIPPRAQSTPHYLPQSSGSANRSFNDRRRGDPWAYSPPPMPPSVSPVSYRDVRPTEDETISDGETMHSEDGSDDESDAGPSVTLPSENPVAPEGSGNSRVGPRRRSF